MQDQSSKFWYLKKLQEATSKTNETLQMSTRVETKLQGRPGINTRDSAEKYSFMLQRPQRLCLLILAQPGQWHWLNKTFKCILSAEGQHENVSCIVLLLCIHQHYPKNLWHKCLDLQNMIKKWKHQSQTKISRARYVLNEIKNHKRPIVFQAEWIQATFWSSSKK